MQKAEEPAGDPRLHATDFFPMQDGERKREADSEMRGFPAFLPDPDQRHLIQEELTAAVAASLAIFICLIFVSLPN